MPDRAEHTSFDTMMRTAAAPEAEAARLRFAAARVRTLECIEQRLLELAVRTEDDTEARWLESWADTAWRDARALRQEHAEDRRRAPGRPPTDRA